ncbi:MAG TPA: response regulator [Candidatus Methylacidiphilales bacterium]
MSKGEYAVLIVDDSPDDRFFLRALLARKPEYHIVGEARDGQVAIDWLKAGTQRADLVFLDLKMPVKNGFEVLQWIQNQSLRDLTVVIMSGSWLQEDIAKSISLGAHAYFKKTSLKEEQDQMLCDLEKLLHSPGSNGAP